MTDRSVTNRYVLLSGKENNNASSVLRCAGLNSMPSCLRALALCGGWMHTELMTKLCGKKETLKSMAHRANGTFPPDFHKGQMTRKCNNPKHPSVFINECHVMFQFIL